MLSHHRFFRRFDSRPLKRAVTLEPAERGRGTSPVLADTDNDGLSDAVETQTGVFAGPADTGSDPLFRDTDGGGEGDGDEVASGRSPLDPSDDLVPRKLNTVLVDGEGFRWDVDPDGSLRSGSRHAFSDPFRLAVEGEGFPDHTWVLIDGRGESLWIGPARVGRLDVTRNLFVPSEGGAFARYLEVIHNPTDAEVATTVDVRGAVGTHRETFIEGTSSGDLTFDAGDHWVVTGIPENRENPAVTFVPSGPNGILEPAVSPFSDGSFRWRYEVVVPPGASVGLLHFAAQSDDATRAIEKAEDLVDLRGRAAEGLSPDVDLLNFALDADRDGMPDRFERRYGLDPSDPADALADLDGDGLVNLDEFVAGTDPTLADTDGDGWIDGDEVHAHGTDPRLADTDGDGRGDAEDPYPWGRIAATLSLPGAAFPGEPARVGVELRSNGKLLSEAVSFVLEAAGGEASFAEEASSGTTARPTRRSPSRRAPWMERSATRTRRSTGAGATPGPTRSPCRRAAPRPWRTSWPAGGNPPRRSRPPTCSSISTVRPATGSVPSRRASSSGDESLDATDRWFIAGSEGTSDAPVLFVSIGDAGASVEPSGIQLLDTIFREARALRSFEPDGDEDGDGLTNEDETRRGTNPLLPDTDGGGLEDGDEVELGRDPLDPADDLASSDALFLRGDVDGDRRLTVTDAVWILRFLFGSGPPPSPLDRADVNDDGRIRIDDAVRLLRYLFTDGSAPPPPFPERGPDPTPDGLE